jgi:CYTH domain-containing protein/lipoprotein-anchoring transpeptidase ErfK/SrfK
MGMEIERKFLLADDGWRQAVKASESFAQGYLNGAGKASVRIRIEGQRANINIKAAQVGSARAEYEYEIPLADAREMLDTLSLTVPVEKTRHWVEHAGHTWEIDEFSGENTPLIVAEIELDEPDEAFERPSWLGEEVTDDARYYNHALAFHPYNHWAQSSAPRIDIDLHQQRLIVWDSHGKEIVRYPVSTAAKGGGEFEGSFQTPRGRHHVRAKIGTDAAPGTVFVGRRPTGERWSEELDETYPDRDWILSRILWLSGDEVGVNRLGAVDTMRRYIYIHGAPDNVPMGKPASHGCIRMRNADVIDLFDRIPIGTVVSIHERKLS